ncbi:MAG: hypothetical protein ACLUFT_12665 [Gemmiger formicilis]|uniref:hypothetical protein n=1 Tax=Gemmiger formicilis TaxID=745368 RepID=UPI0039923F8B
MPTPVLPRSPPRPVSPPTAADAVAFAKRAASIVALLPANNLAGPALFDFRTFRLSTRKVHRR